MSSLIQSSLAFLRGWYPRWQMELRSTHAETVFGYAVFAVLVVVFTIWTPRLGGRKW